ncbi:hypothetical protein [Streptomyces niveus]|uniref:hypothetical protein n=1 Tax=Streptomyces niveus TaxID=193462 RepID=UPI0037BCC3FA
MDSSTITAAWVAGWAVSRSASAPVTRDEVLQYVKQLGHVLVRFGRARGGPAA